jgi:uncharacterized protein YqgC (DUF456 family)
MDMLTIVGIVVGALLVAGLLGSIVPWLPGPLLILVGALVWAVATDFARVGPGRLILLTVLALLSYLLNFVAGAAGTRRYGGTRWGAIGAVVGGFAGLLFGPPGLLLGPMVGAVAGELLRGADLVDSVRSGWGAAVGLLAGIVADMAIALVMVSLFLWWAWRG